MVLGRCDNLKVGIGIATCLDLGRLAYFAIRVATVFLRGVAMEIIEGFSAAAGRANLHQIAS